VDHHNLYFPSNINRRGVCHVGREGKFRQGFGGETPIQTAWNTEA